jgi:hypothetical protein
MRRVNWKLVKRQPGNNGPRLRHRGPRAPGRRFLPGVDAMEDRTVLSPLLVTSPADSGTGSLRAIIASAPSGSTIEFANFVHNITLTSGELDVSTNLDIGGPGANKLTMSGNNSSRVFEIAAGNVVISGLTITDGQKVGANGGGILVDAGATLNVDHVVMTDNQALADNGGADGGSGGAIENLGSLTVSDSSFTNNVGSLGSTAVGSEGGAIDSSGPSLTVINSTFTDNEAVGVSTGYGYGAGGAINTTGSTAVLTHCTFDGNTASGRIADGGAINTNASAAGTMAINDSSFIGNQAVASNGANDLTYPDGGEALGGAVANASPLTITNSAFTDNLAKGGDMGDNSSDGVDGGGFVGVATGGGVCNFFSSLTVTSSAFTGNQAIGGNSALGPGGDAAGGGVLGAGFASTTLTNVRFVGNQAVGVGGGPGSTGGSGVGGGFYSGVYSSAAVSQALFRDNVAQGGAGGSGSTGGDGQGGAIANGGGFGELVVAAIGAGPDNSSLTLDQSMLLLNVAQGGAGGAGANGGDGLGGGCYVFGGTTASIDATLIIANAALGGSPGWGGISGQGQGGGLYIGTTADVTLDTSTVVTVNYASTSDNNIFGTYTMS